MFKRNRSNRLLRLPSCGRLLVCTDLHGNLPDFLRMKEIFLAGQAAGDDPFLLFTGDLIHGPNCPAEEWPEYLGRHYHDESGQVVEEFIALQRRFPGRVACLLGNHEHSHVGGPHTPKFWPDETSHFEQAVGPQRTQKYLKLFRSFPTVATSGCGVVATHAAPNVAINGPKDIQKLRYRGFEDAEALATSGMDVLGGLLWSRHCTPETARQFLAALSQPSAPLHLVVYGHEIVFSGYEAVSDEQLRLSTSFGVADEYKFYLSLDCSRHYLSAHQLAEGRELLRLWP